MRKRASSSPSMPIEAFQKISGVSRETGDKLLIYGELLQKWQKSLNLVAQSTLADMWRRHFLDSAQLFPLIPEGAKTLVDMGSGAGFPGLVLAAMGCPDVHLIESDHRKGIFLRETARQMEVLATVHICRIEDAPPIRADVVTARALAPMKTLLEYMQRFAHSGTVGLFLKGAQADMEMADLPVNAPFSFNLSRSLTAEDGKIISVTAR